MLFRAFSEKSPWDILQPGHHKLFCEYDSILGWKKIPNHNGLRITNEYEIVEEFNSKGIRRPEYSYNKLKNECRILIIGDSFVEGR